MIAVALATVALAGTPGRACPPITVWVTGSGAFTYDVRIGRGAIACVDARSVLRRYVFAAVAPGGWVCFRGHSADLWAAACSKGGAVVRAYGPRRERSPWRIAAARLLMPVLAPEPPPVELRLSYVRPQQIDHCGAAKEQLTADYAQGKRELYVIEGRPRLCADAVDARVAGRPLVQGVHAVLYEVCDPVGCGRAAGPEVLLLRLHGVQVGLRTTGIGESDLLAIAATLRIVLA